MTGRRTFLSRVAWAVGLVALAELAFSGCTCASDHLYIFPNGARLDDEIDAAREIGVRLHATRGSMSIGPRPWAW